MTLANDEERQTAIPAVPSVQGAIRSVARAARDHNQITGLTHDFYRYPARFSPRFAASVIDEFSRPGDLVLDPYMGGATSIVEAAARGRDVVGNDINALSHFLATVKTTVLTEAERSTVTAWAGQVVPRLRVESGCDRTDSLLRSAATKNLSVPRARFIKKIIASALASLDELESAAAQNFVRCAILNTAQWALDGRKQETTTVEFRKRMISNIESMLQSAKNYAAEVAKVRAAEIILSTADAAQLPQLPIFAGGRRASLTVTSPPYPGVHVLYHRWQVDGRRESPAPYWITNRPDGQGASYYSFSSRTNLDGYFETSLHTLRAIRQVMEDGGVMVQLIAFSDRKSQLNRYLSNMEQAGFSEIRDRATRVWRGVPNRKWHASLQGHTSSAREVMLLHRAV